MFLRKTLLTAILSCVAFTTMAKCTGNAGEIAACHLDIAYKNATTWCGQNKNDNRPGSLCSGVLLRALKPHKERKHPAWDIPPKYAGVSFSYLRSDANFDRLVYNYQTGFIVYPFDHTPKGMQKLEPKCAFPFDGDSVERAGSCGINRTYEGSKPCYQLNPLVDTGQKWLEHFEKNKDEATAGKHACGFMLNEPNKKAQFNTFIQSRNTVISSNSHKEAFHAENEIVLPRWSTSTNIGSIPIEAFFYLDGSKEGLTSAQADQEAFYKATTNSSLGVRAVPIIKITLPQNNSGGAHFSYSAQDQKLNIK